VRKEVNIPIKILLKPAGMFKDKMRLFTVALLTLALLLNACRRRQPPPQTTFDEVFRLAVAKDVPALIEACSDMESTIRRIALTALADIGDKQASKQFRKSLSDPNEFSREAAAYGLGALRDSSAKVSLKKRLRDESVNVRKAASWALAMMGFSEEILDEGLKGEKDGLTKEFLKLNLMVIHSRFVEGYEEEYAQRLLISLGPTPSMANEWIDSHGREQVIRELTDALRDEAQLLSTRVVAAHTLGVLRAVEGVESLLKVVKESDNWPIRLKALAVLEVLAEERAVTPLIDILETSEDLKLRSKIAKTLGYLGDSRAVVPLMEILVSPEYVGLTVIRPPIGAHKAWVQWRILKQEIQVSAATALGRISDRRAETLLRAFADPTFRSALSEKRRAGKPIELSELKLMAAKEAGVEVQKVAGEALTRITK